MIRTFYRDRIRPEDPYDVNDARGLQCNREGCAETIVFVHTYQGVGSFCSERCRQMAVRDHNARQRKAG